MPASKTSRKKTLLLVFIHGFKGGDKTFDQFPERLRTLLGHVLSNVTVLAIRYPQYETKGELQGCVSQFKEWLQNKVIDLEVANGTPSPTIDPSVRLVLVGHSMGGIVAAETLFSIANDQPVPSPSPFTDPSLNATSDIDNEAFPSIPSTPGPPPNGTNATTSASPSTSKPASLPAFMFPSVIGILAFDTPYLGVAPGVIAHGAEGHWNTISSAYNAYNTASSFFGFKSGSSTSSSGTSTPTNTSSSFFNRALPGSTGGPVTNEAAREAAVATAITDKDADAASTPLWHKWGRYAMFAGAAGAVAAGGAAAAYWKRHELNEGVGWAVAHLDFVGCLARAEDLQARVRRLCELSRSPGSDPEKEGNGGKIGWANLYTSLGRAIEGQKTDGTAEANAIGVDRRTGNIKVAKAVVGSGRTFVVVPKEKSVARRFWIKCTNDKALDEIGAHTSMFKGEQNPGYFGMAERAKKIVESWCTGEWFKDAGMKMGNSSTRETTPAAEGTPIMSGPERKQSSKMPLKRMNTDVSVNSESKADRRGSKNPLLRRSTSEMKTSQ
ncbi:MAG: hypothetical protein M1821_000064 [Bathelium mastoideum]|nr:MAG: hypothetical protein M1821_000064 [Bathelium mastoideum]